MANVGIKNSWTLLAFAQSHGKMQVGTFANTQTDEEFRSCVFTNNTGDRCFVSFSANLGELTPAEISARKNELQVVELNSGNFKLCKQGEGNTWEDVEL